MLLSRLERAFVNSPLRTAMQRYEARRLLAMGGSLSGGRALDVGCGCGAGVELILELSGADRVDAFDLDPTMIELARRRLARFGDRVVLTTGDVTAIEADDGSYDAVFEFGVLHHVPNWRDALREVYRVLKPGGRLYMEEVFTALISHPPWRRLLYIPEKDYFDHDGFRDALTATGLDVLAWRGLRGWFGLFVACRPEIPDFG